MKQTIYIRYVIAKLSQSVQISLQTSSNSILQRLLWKLKPRTSFWAILFIKIFDKKMYFVILHKLAKFHYLGCVYFPSCSVKCVWCFMLRHLMDTINLNTYLKVKIWLSQERKQLLKWNKEHFSLLHKCSPLDLQNRLAKI